MRAQLCYCATDFSINLRSHEDDNLRFFYSCECELHLLSRIFMNKYNTNWDQLKIILEINLSKIVKASN